MPTRARLLRTCHLAGVRLYELPVIQDSRGSLSFAEYGEVLAFHPKRYFFVYDVGEGQKRGGHAHRRAHQLLTCVKGSCRVLLDDGNSRDTVLLDKPQLALYLPPRIWTTEDRFSSDAVLVFLASEVYDPDEFIKDYDEFISAAIH